MHVALGPIAAVVTTVLLGCNTAAPSAPAAATPSPTATMGPAPVAGPSTPPAADWAFGAIESIRTATERQIIYQRGDDPSKKPYGEGASYHVVVGGKTYMLHYSQASKLPTLKVGDTVNLHPTGWIGCVEGQSCVELFNLFKGSREQPPLFTP
jgi:hypothetical protein